MGMCTKKNPKIDSEVTYLGIYCCAKTVVLACPPLELVKYYYLSLYIIFIIQPTHSRVIVIILESIISQN